MGKNISQIRDEFSNYFVTLQQTYHNDEYEPQKQQHDGKEFAHTHLPHPAVEGMAAPQDDAAHGPAHRNDLTGGDDTGRQPHTHRVRRNRD